MTFEEYLITKKIDEELFKQAEPSRWQEFRDLFAQMHPESFTTQKKFLINDIRRRYQLKVVPVATAPPADTPKPAAKPTARPVARPVPVASAPAKETPPIETTPPQPVSDTPPPAEPKPAARSVIKRPAAVIRKPPTEEGQKD